MDQFYAALWTYFAPPLTEASKPDEEVMKSHALAPILRIRLCGPICTAPKRCRPSSTRERVEEADQADPAIDYRTTSGAYARSNVVSGCCSRGSAASAGGVAQMVGDDAPQKLYSVLYPCLDRRDVLLDEVL